MRLTVVAHAETLGTRPGIFGDRSSVARPELIDPLPPRPGRSAAIGPEPACHETAERLGLDATADARLAGPDTGTWTGLTLDEVATRDSEGLAGWLTDPRARPHGGESLADLVDRVGGVLDAREWPAAGSVLVGHPLVARAALTHALDAPPAVALRAEVGPLTTVTISCHAGRWRLLGLTPS